MTSGTNKVLLASVVVLLIALVGLFVWRPWGVIRTYHAVYLRTGDLYFGELTRFPEFGLRNVYVLQLNQDPQNPFSVQRFARVFWGPEDYIQMNRAEVVWISKLDPNGQLAQFIRSGGASGVPQLPPEASGSAPTSTGSSPSPLR